ncbi:hypothetical protein AB4Y63_15890 [Leifsonia sp. YAF41]|uniref:hypothetical protein n=1 Tax=Leifsonia sp. YAF41 TaxID=3233086 RepID=UPI003F95FFED
MVRLLLRTLIFLLSATLGLLVASWLLPDVVLSVSGFIITIVVFALAQNVLSPFIMKVTARNAPAFLGGVGLLSTFVALLLATLFTGGLHISGWQTWILATLIVWLVTALATFFLPMIMLKKGVQKARNSSTNLPI